MSFKKGDKVEILRCADDASAVGKVGEIIEDVPPGELTGGKWTVHLGFVSGFLGTDPLCDASEIRKVG